jgi:uncharacterized protein YkwD
VRLLLKSSITRRSILQAAAALLRAAAAIGVASRAGEASVNAEPGFEWRIFSRINELREQSGVGLLQWSASLAECATQQSIRKAELRFPGHSDPELGDLAARLNGAGIGWAQCGENLFMEKGWDDPVHFAVVSWWYSPGHQANLLNPEYTETGVGLAQGQDDAWFVTQIFLAPPPRETAVRRHR